MIDRRKTAKGTRYEVRLRAPDGGERSRTFRTKREAERYEATQRADVARGVWVDPRGGSVTFEEWSARWLAGNPAKRVRSVERDEQIIRLHLDPILGRRPLAGIAPLDVQGLVRGWVATGLAPSTVRRHYAVLRAILGAAVEAEILGRTPCRGVKLPTVEAHERRELAAADVRRLAGAVGVDYEALVYVGAILGLRWSEAAGLRVRCLDLPRRTVTVVEGLHEVGGVIRFEPPKSDAARRTFTIPSPLVDLLARHLTRRGLTGANPEALVFAGSKGGPLRYSNFRDRVWIPACVATGLGRLVKTESGPDRRMSYQGLGFHDLRRAAATAMVASGVDVRTAQERLGHADPRMTLAVYAQATRAGDKAAADRLGEHFMGGSVSAGAATPSAG